MVVRLGFRRDALIEAGAGEAKAGKAAEELADYENEFTGVRSAIAAFRSDSKAELASVRGDISLPRWMTTSVFALLLAVALQMFLH